MNTMRSGNVWGMRLASMAGLALLWLAGVSRVLAVTVAIPTNTQILGIQSNEGSGECAYGESVTVSALVTPIAGTTAPTGTVQFLVGGTVLGSASLVPTGLAPGAAEASLTTSALCSVEFAFGNYPGVTAKYLGNSSPAFDASSSTSFSVNEIPASTTTSISSATNPSAAGQAVTFTVTVWRPAIRSGVARRFS